MRFQQIYVEYFIDLCEIWILQHQKMGQTDLINIEDVVELFLFSDTHQVHNNCGTPFNGQTKSSSFSLLLGAKAEAGLLGIHGG